MTMNNHGLEALRDLGSNAPRVFVYATGAGAGIQKHIWEIPGCSNFLIGSGFPYESDTTSRYLGVTPEKFVSIDTALELAMAAYLQAAKAGTKSIGIGLTASVASTSEHRGAHRIAVASVSETECLSWGVKIPKGFGSEQRCIDGCIADELGIVALLRAAGIYTDASNMTIPYAAENESDCMTYKPAEVSDIAKDLLKNNSCFLSSGKRMPESDIKNNEFIFYPGSFNPFHYGHENAANAIRQAGAKKFGECRDVMYTTTVDSVHKAPLTVSQMLDKVSLMRGRNFCLTFNDPLFIDKARRHPGAWFGLGADTLLRMLDDKWGYSVPEMLDELHLLGTKLFIVGRLVEGKYTTLADILLSGKIRHPSNYKDMFIDVPGRWDISSTELRNKNGR